MKVYIKRSSYLAIQSVPKTEINQQNALKNCLKYEQKKQYYTGFEEDICLHLVCKRSVQTW